MDLLQRWTLAVAATVGLCATAPVAAQGLFPTPETFPDLRLEVAGTVNAIVKYNDGVADHYLIGGDFDLVNGEARQNLARLDADGVLDANWTADTDGAVLALALAGDQLFIGGSFGQVDGQTRVRLAKIDADDGGLANWAPDANNTVNALQADGSTVWAGGAFTVVEGQARRFVAAIDAGAGSVTSFNAAISGGGAVHALLLDGVAGELYIGGQGRLKGSQRALLKVDATSGAAINWNPGIGPQGGSRIRALAMDATTVYAVGRIKRAGGNNARGNGARFLKAGASLQAWNPASDAEILAVALDGAFAFVGGDFLNLGGHVRLARVDAASGAASVGWDADADRRVATLLLDGTNLLVGGGFASLAATDAQGGLSRLSSATAAIDVSFVGDAAGPGFVSAFAFDAVGGMIVGGSFDAARQDGELTLYPRRNIVRLLPSGGAEAQFELDRTWSVDVLGEVHGVAIDGNDLFISGNFSQVGASARLRLAKLAADTATVDPSWNQTADAPVRQLDVDGANARLYAVGDFTTFGGAARAGVGRLATTGTGAVDANWNPDPDDIVDSLLLSGADVYLGGSFSTLNAGAAAHVGLARVDDATGAADATFVADVDTLGAVHALAEGPEGLYVGGVFATLGGGARNGIGRVLGDGSLDPAFNPNVALGDVHAFALDATAGFVYFGGSFSTAGLQMHPNLARAAIADGSVDPTWRPGTDGSVVQMAVPATGQVLIAGAFANVTDEMRNGIAQLGQAGSDLTAITIDSITPTGGSAGTDSVFGQGYVVAWTVSNTTNVHGTPTGSVTVTASTGESCTAAAAAGSCALSATASGLRTLVAAFTGDMLFVDSVSAAEPHTVLPAQVTLSVTTTPNPSDLVTAVTADVVLNVAAPGGGTPEGAVVVTIDGGAGCTIDLSLDTSCSLGVFPAFAYYDIEATYTDSNAPANHQAAPATTLHAVGTITTLTLDIPSTAIAGTPVTATVDTTAIPDGQQVTVTGGSGCSITINANTGDCEITFGTLGANNVTADYAGDNALLPAQDQASVTVSGIATSITLSALPAAPVVGEGVTLSAATVGIHDGATLTVTNAPGCPTITIDTNAGSCNTSFAAAGMVTVQADFAQTAIQDAATDELAITVGKISTSFALSLSPPSPLVGQSVTVSLDTPQLPADAMVTITGGSGCSIDRSVSDSCNLSFAAAGAAVVQGQFLETATHLASSASVNPTVAQAATNFAAFNASVFTAEPGDTITFTWTVLATAPGQGTPTGNVRVSVNGDGTPPSCTVAVGAGTCDIVFPDEGSFSMRADYLGDANFEASSSTTAGVIIASGAPVEADLQIAKIVARSRLDVPNQIEQVEFLIVVANAGPASVTAASISDLIPAGLTAAVWTCTPDDVGASCSAPDGTGSVTLTANLAVDSSVTILLQADVEDAPFPGITNTATVSAPVDLNDPAPGNNSASAFYQACPGNTATLGEHSCLFSDGFEAAPAD